MLATLVDEPFDSDEHLFEIKWDGIRALSCVEGGDYRVATRNRQDLKSRYPELAFLPRLASGTVLDGELVVLEDGRPSFSRSLERVQAKKDLRIAALARSWPATYVVFDVLYHRGKSVMPRPLTERRELLREIVDGAGEARLVGSDGITGQGRAFFEQVRAQALEGLVAKELTSAYFPGKRTRSWLKVKTTREMPCLVLGWIPDERGVLTSLIVAAEEDGKLVSVGRVGSGLTDELRERLQTLCEARARATPVIDCPEEGSWVEPGLYCTVSYLERTRNGLRAPVFVGLIEEEG